MTDKEASAGVKRQQRKDKYKVKFEKMLQEYKNAFVVGVDNVGSLQMQKIRIALRGKGELIMGKNTLMRMIVTNLAEANPKLEELVPLLRGNVGLVFTKGDLAAVRTVMLEYKVPAAAKAGTLAPTDVFVPPGPTGMDPGQTGFFQALNIATKIVKGAIEIINQVHLVRKGDKISSSAVSLLTKLDIKPFFYGMTVQHVYEDGFVYPSEVLDITPDEVQRKFLSGVGKLQALGIAAKYPSELSLSYFLANGFRKLLSLSFATAFSFKEADALKKAAAAGPAAGAGAAKGGKADAKDAKADKGADKGKAGDKGKKDDKAKAPAAAEPEPEEDDAFGGAGNLFGD